MRRPWLRRAWPASNGSINAAGRGASRRSPRDPDGAEMCEDRRPRQPLGGGRQTSLERGHRPRHSGGPQRIHHFADHSCDGRLAALDLLIEAEQPGFLGLSGDIQPEVAAAARAAIPEYWAKMGRSGRVFQTVVTGPRRHRLAPDNDAAIAFINDYAPGIWRSLSDEPFAYLGRSRMPAKCCSASTPVTFGQFRPRPRCGAAHQRRRRHPFRRSRSSTTKRTSVGL